VERYTHFNNRNPETEIHQRNQDYSPPKSSDNEVSVVLSFRASPSAFAPSSPNPFTTDTPEWRDPNTISKTVPMGDAVNMQSQQAHSHMGRGVLIVPLSQSDFEQSNQWSATHTSTKETRNTSHQRNQDYSQCKFSDNEVSVVLSFRASPSAFAPSAPNRLPTDTPERRDPNTNSAKQLQWTLPTGNRHNRHNRNNRTRFMVVLIVPLHNPL
jgi:hypothetical protein